MDLLAPYATSPLLFQSRQWGVRLQPTGIVGQVTDTYKLQVVVDSVQFCPPRDTPELNASPSQLRILYETLLNESTASADASSCWLDLKHQQTWCIKIARLKRHKW